MAPSTTDTDQAPATFGRYAETPYDQMTPEQQEGYRILAKAEGASYKGRRRSGSTIRTLPRRWLVTDTDETLMRPGDTVIIRGTNHAWSNRSNAPCLLVGTMTDATLQDER
jgi:hypothetical protein